MAYARFTHDSDVYVYADSRGGYTCERCPTIGSSFHCATASTMGRHLITEHRAKGHRVPDEALAELAADSHEQPGVVEVVWARDRKQKAEIAQRPDSLFQVWVYREVPGDGEYEPESYWAAVDKDAILTDTIDRARELARERVRC